MIVFSRMSLAALWLGLLSMAPETVAAPESLQVLGRSTVSGYSVSLDAADRAWLRDKGSLLLGASAPDYAPFGITGNGHEYEGLTADYAGLLGQLLQVDVQVRRYPSRAEALQALRGGAIDMLGSANGFEAGDPELAMSQAYADDQPTLVTRAGDNRKLAPDLAGKRVAMLYHYLPPEAVKAFYPKASLQLYPSTLSAIGAVAFGQADVYLGDSISAHYLITKNYLNNVQLADFSRLEVQPFAFALARDNTRLLRIINSALQAIPGTERMAILRRWSAGGASMPGHQRLHFSVNEQRWLDTHPRIRVVINDHFMPLTFIDQQAHFRGISADVLAKISLRTGLKFDIRHGESLEDLIAQVKSGEADVVAAFPPGSDYADELSSTRPYLSNPYVLVAALDTQAPVTPEQMAGKRLALVRGNVLRDYLLQQFPDVELVPAQNAADALAMVASGAVDAAISPLLSASYMISRQYRDTLQITCTVGTEPALIALGTRRDAPQLHSILDKALLSIAPEEMDELTNRWRTEIVVEDSYWLRHRATVLQGFAIAALLLLLALGWIGYLRHLIRKRRQAEVALNDQLEFMRVLIDGTPHPIYVRDREARLVLCNSGYLEVFGAKRQSVVGKTLLESAPGDPVEARLYHNDYLRVMEQGLPRVQDRHLTVASGEALTIYQWMLPYRGSDGAVSGMIGGWIDVSERQHLLEQLRIAKDGSDDANRAKTTFLATMSHEIRTPMNAVIGMLELALKKAEEGIVDRAAIEVASGAAHGLLALIGDILDVARIESGRMSLAPERANLRELVESVARVFEGLARQKHLGLQLALDDELDRDVLIDPLHFKQVLSNLLSNAIKFTDQGLVRLIAEVVPGSEDERLAVRLRVEDTGSGISLEDQQRLFQPFTQVGDNRESTRGGSGLGLVISRTLCEMMGGTLTMSSLPGEGTQVEIRLDLPLLDALLQAPLAGGKTPLPMRALAILVVDDYPANRLLLCQQLSYLGHRVEEAAEGVQGLHAWRAGRFDMIITDCNMPLMDGYALTRAIREEEHARGLSPILILGFTANAQPEEKQRCIDAGMNDCLFKPIGLEVLGARLAQVFPEPAAGFPGTEAEAPTDDFDLDGLAQLTGGDTEALNSLISELVTCNTEDTAQLLRLSARHDLPGLADLAHRIKGGARMVRAQGLVSACDALEDACRERDASSLADAVGDLQQALEHLTGRLRASSLWSG
ncbi:transporter substrate-binding domain-containing protein [Pseudomonas sp. Z2-11]